MKHLMAIDLGSTSLKACIFDLDGNLVASASRPTEKIHPSKEHPEWVIWDPDQIWNGAAAAAKDAVAKLGDASLIAGVSVTGMGMDGVPIGEDGRHLYPFISWHDPRTEPQAQWWRANIGEERSFCITGFPSWAMTAAMRILWMQQHEAAIMARAAKWLLIEDFLNHKLCGRIATDFSMASCMLLLDQQRRAWSDDLLNASGIPRSLLPDPQPSGTLLGEIHDEAARLTGLRPGTPVVLGGHDHICGTLPVGAYKPGAIFNILGTWESLIATIPAPVMTPTLQKAGICIQSHVATGLYTAWGGAIAGESLEWFRRTYGADAEKQAATAGGSVWDPLLSELDQTQPGAGGIMYLPHITGGVCPVSDKTSRAAFIGIGTATRRADLLRAVIEGINYQFTDIIRSLESGLGCAFNKITVAGGGSRNKFWVQNKADMIGFPIEAAEVSEASPLGVAMVAGLGLGLYKDLDEAYDRVKRPGMVFEPRKEQTARYAELFQVYKQLYPALRPVHDGLAEASKK